MQVVHTAGVPPSLGKSTFATMSCTQNSRSALRNIVAPNNKTIGRERSEALPDDAGGVFAEGRLMYHGMFIPNRQDSVLY